MAHHSEGFGCHKVDESGLPEESGEVPPPAVEELPEMGVYLLARLRFWIVCQLFPELGEGAI